MCFHVQDQQETVPPAVGDSSPRKRGWLSSSPFKKLSHLKRSCYSLPARRKLEWADKASDGVVKASKSTDTCVQPTTVNLVTFRAQDMSGESFSTLQMQNIMSNLQHQLGSPPRDNGMEQPSGDPVDTDVAPGLAQEVGEECQSHSSAYPATVSQDDCTVPPQDAQPLQEAHSPETGHTNTDMIDSVPTEVRMYV